MDRLRGEQEHFDKQAEECIEEDALYGNLFTQKILEEIKAYSVSLTGDLRGKKSFFMGVA